MLITFHSGLTLQALIFRPGEISEFKTQVIEDIFFSSGNNSSAIALIFQDDLGGLTFRYFGYILPLMEFPGR